MKFRRIWTLHSNNVNSAKDCNLYRILAYFDQKNRIKGIRDNLSGKSIFCEAKVYLENGVLTSSENKMFFANLCF